MKLLTPQQFSLALQYYQRCGGGKPKTQSINLSDFYFILFQELRELPRTYRKLFLCFAGHGSRSLMRFIFPSAIEGHGSGMKHAAGRTRRLPLLAAHLPPAGKPPQHGTAQSSHWAAHGHTVWCWPQPPLLLCQAGVPGWPISACTSNGTTAQHITLLCRPGW